VMNTATAYGVYDESPLMSNEATETVTADQSAALTLVKSASPTTYSVAGEVITYTFTVTNNGNVTLAGIVVNDPLVGLSAITFVSSTGSSPAGTLEVGESATYTATYTIAAGDIGEGKTVINTATATGNDPEGDPVTADDGATVTYVAPFIPDPSPEVPVTLVPSINIKKYVSVDGGSNWLDAEATPGPNVEVGREVRFKFVVTNSGNVTLSDIRLSDSVMDLSAAPVPATLAPGSSFDYIIGRAAVAGQHSNTAVAQGTYNQDVYSDSDLGHYFGVVVEQTPVPAPSITVKKYVSVDGGTTWLDAETITGPSVAVGSSVRFKYVITNSGNVTLSNVRLTDNRFSLSGAVVPFSLEAGRSYEYVLNQVAVAGQHSNTATATGEYNQQIYRDTDMAHYFGFEPDDERETEQDQPVSGTVDLPDGATPRIGRPPANGIATVDEDGNWVYTPTPGFSGRDQFTIIVRKADGTEYEVTIEIMVDEPTVSPIDEPEADKPVTPTPRTAGAALASLYSLWLMLVASFVLRRGVGRKGHLAAKLRG
jgi:uncharacterized repeat protein (TIGR01451 family)